MYTKVKSKGTFGNWCFTSLLPSFCIQENSAFGQQEWLKRAIFRKTPFWNEFVSCICHTLLAVSSERAVNPKPRTSSSLTRNSCLEYSDHWLGSSSYLLASWRYSSCEWCGILRKASRIPLTWHNEYYYPSINVMNVAHTTVKLIWKFLPYVPLKKKI